MQSDSNLFWVALQSNTLADTSDVRDGFKKALRKMKDDLTKDGWILPQLESNMRNQINISNINVEKGFGGNEMQNSISKLKSEANVVGEVPILIKVRGSNEWNEKKDAILKYCIKEMHNKDNKNIVVLFDDLQFKEVQNDLKRLIKYKTVVEYPSNYGKQTGLQNIRDFVEKGDFVLVTNSRYFHGCEASKVIFLTDGYAGVRSSLMRAVKDLICIDVGGYATINGLKVDNKFQ